MEVANLSTVFETPRGVARAVDDVSFTIGAGEMVALAGESGCGKSALALSILRLLPPGGRVTGGAVRFEGHDLLGLGPAELRDIRGRRLAIVFQEPASALDPVRTVGSQIAEVARAHGERSKKVAWDRAVQMLARTGIPDADENARRYPHQFSGGMRQRALIAMALMLNPALVIADEPTTALDATIQAQILQLLGDLQRETGTALLLITHDLAVARATCSRVMVMYAGQIVEDAPADRLFRSPVHPYSEGLLASMPRLGDPPGRLPSIPGAVPSAMSWPQGCRFHGRCSYAWDRCSHEMPRLKLDHAAEARCHLIEEPSRRVRAAVASS